MNNDSHPLKSLAMKGDAEKKLRESLRRLVQVFRKYPGSRWWVDGLDVRPEGSSATLAMRANQLSHEDFDDFSWHSLSAVSTLDPEDLELLVSALRYFLPRLAAIFSRQEVSPAGKMSRRLPFPLITLCGPKVAHDLNQARWTQWPAPEREAILDWMHAWMDFEAECLVSKEFDGFAEALLFAAASGDRVDEYLRQLLQHRRGVAAIVFAALIQRDYLLKSGWPDGWQRYWGEASVDQKTACEYISIILSQEVRTALEEVFFDTVDQDLAQSLSTAMLYAEQSVEFGARLTGTPLAQAVGAANQRVI